MMLDAIRNFAKQFEFVPKIENETKLPRTHKFILVGMGGSHLAADLLKIRYPEMDLIIHMDYGLPVLPGDDIAERLIILSSYSGNTEEVRDAFEIALSRNLHLAAASVGGKLQELAQLHGIPYIQMPHTGIQPRLALGFSLVALLKVMGKEDELADIAQLGHFLNKPRLEEQGKQLAASLKDKIPVIYSSRRNVALAYNWKIKFNETGKIPAFYNTFPELNHNEMTGFDTVPTTKPLSERFHFIFLTDKADHPRIGRRMEVCKRLYEDRGFTVTNIPLEGASFWDGIFTSLLLADWTAYYLAAGYGAESEQVPMVEEFKKLIE